METRENARRGFTYPEAKYLKASGDRIDVKVTIRTINGEWYICIRKSEFRSFETALRYLQHIVENEIHRSEVLS